MHPIDVYFPSKLMPSSETTGQIYTVLIQVRAAMPNVDTRWSFFQDPLIVEDPFGEVYPVPAEYDYELLKSIVSRQLRKTDNVKLWLPVLFDASDKVVLSTKELHPGMRISVGVVQLNGYKIYADLSESGAGGPVVDFPLQWYAFIYSDNPSHSSHSKQPFRSKQAYRSPPYPHYGYSTIHVRYHAAGYMSAC
jgi:hypothetical protein